MLSDRVRLRLAPSRKFKTALVKIFVRTDLAAEAATEIATLPYVLRHGTRAHPSKRELTRTRPTGLLGPMLRLRKSRPIWIESLG